VVRGFCDRNILRLAQPFESQRFTIRGFAADRDGIYYMLSSNAQTRFKAAQFRSHPAANTVAAVSEVNWPDRSDPMTHFGRVLIVHVEEVGHYRFDD
jgi:hypothetical protein